MLLSGIIIALLCTEVLCQQPAPASAVNHEMRRYQKLAQHAVQVSMNMSVIVTGMNKELFRRSDEIEKQTAELEETITIKAQALSVNLNATNCLQDLMIRRKIQDLLRYVSHTTKCLLAEADKNSMLETLLTTTLNHHRAHVFESRKALESCSLDATSWARCSKTVSNELDGLEKLARLNMNRITRQTAQRRHELPTKIRICESLSSKYIKVMKNTLNRIKLCEGNL